MKKNRNKLDKWVISLVYNNLIMVRYFLSSQVNADDRVLTINTKYFNNKFKEY